MAPAAGKLASAYRSLWSRVRVQLGSGLLIAVIAPWFARVHIQIEELDLFGLQASLAGTFIALVLGYYGFRRLSQYPGVKSLYYIFPFFTVSYGIILLIFFFGRLDYSRLHFISSFALCNIWYYFIYFKVQRGQRLRIGIVPFGKVSSLFKIADVDWVRLTDGIDSRGRLDVIVADLRADIPDDWERFLTDRAIGGTMVMHVKQMEESLTGRVAIEHLSENTLGSLIPGIVYAKIKRAGDLMVALIAAPLLAPFLLAIVFLIRLDSKGPVIFKQQRMGFRGRPFLMYKFRTMRHESSSPANAREAAITRDGDDRVTRLGRILRQYRIDELPQIINILRGEMSWIGPRPEAIELSEWYERELPFYRYRHIVRPGITGWAQVKQGHVAYVDDVLWKLHYDFYYIKNFSFWLDVLIIGGTLRTVLSGFGAR